MSDISTELEAAAFRRLLEHLAARSDVQNISLMTHAGFCRNCLADWYREAADVRGVTLDKDQARERIYHQREASAEELAAFAEAQARQTR